MKTLSRRSSSSLKTNRPLDLELILQCAHKQVSPERAERIRELAENIKDWDSLIRTAYQHGVMPLVYTNLNAFCPQFIPKAIQPECRKIFHGNAQHSILLTAELLKLLNILATQNIPAVPYKGPVLAAAAYGDVSLRQYGDLDIIVQQQDVLKVKQLLLDLGYQPKVTMTADQEVAYLQSKQEHCYVFVHPTTKTMVELHWRITPRYTSAIETRHFWNKRQPFAIAGQTIYNLSLPDWLPILCVHGSRHQWERLAWLCDIAEILQLHPVIQWDELIQQSSELGYRRMFFLGILLAHQLLEAPVSEAMLRTIEADTGVRRLALEVEQQILRNSKADERFLGRTLYHIRVSERWQDKVLYLQSFLQWLIKAPVEV